MLLPASSLRFLAMHLADGAAGDERARIDAGATAIHADVVLGGRDAVVARRAVVFDW